MWFRKYLRKWGIHLLCVLLLYLPLQYTDAIMAEAEEAVELTVLEQQGENYVYLSWTDNGEADGYSVYRSVNGGNMVLIKNVTDKETYNYGLAGGSVYAYKVKPYTIDDMQKKVYGSFSNTLEIQVGVRTPQDLTAETDHKNTVRLSWTGDELADSYYIYRSEDKENWTLVKSVESESAVTYGITQGKDYYYRVRAGRTIGGKKRYSSFSEPVMISVGLKKTKNISVRPASPNSVNISWDAVNNADAYRLYRSDHGGEYRLIKTVSDVSTINYSLDPDTEYAYRVAAVCTQNQTTMKGEYSDEARIRLRLDDVSDLSVSRNSGNSALISWDLVSQANGYRLYKAEDGGEPVLVKTVYDTGTKTYGLKEGKVYGFSVRPIWTAESFTLSGNRSDELCYYNARVTGLTAIQTSIDALTVSWNRVEGADEYRIYRIENGEDTFCLSQDAVEMVYELTEGIPSGFAVSAVRNNTESEKMTAETGSIISDPDHNTLFAEAVSFERVNLLWDPVPNAEKYEIKRTKTEDSTEVIWTVSDNTSYSDTEVEADTAYSYQYRVRYSAGDYNFWGNWISAVSVTTPKAPIYRALLIGEENYGEVLPGPINDIDRVGRMLRGFDQMDWKIYSQADAVRDEIISLIGLAFMDAKETDISLFYYSGHGVTGSGAYYSGALQTVDYQYITIQDLAELLSDVPGKVVVILDSCGSGAAISSSKKTFGSAKDKDFDPQTFNSSVIDIFSSYSSKQAEKSGELAADKFYVMTASAYEQNSRSLMISGLWGGAFTRGMTESCGYDYTSQTWADVMKGDTDHNDILTQEECYRYAADYAKDYQNAQVYPQNSSFKLFYK